MSRKEKYDVVLLKFWVPFMGPCFGTILRLLRRKKSPITIAIIDNILPHEKRFGDFPFTKYFVKVIDGFVAMSSTVNEELNLFDTQKPKIISPHPLFDNFGLIEEKSKALKKIGLSDNFQYVLFFGFIRPYKGLDLLIEAFADERLRKLNIKLLIVGEYYEDKQPYQELIKKYQLDNHIVQVDNFIEDDKVQHYFNASEVLVLPYKSATQSGVTQIAYHFDKPMIATNVGGLKEICPHEQVGFLVQPDPKEIANAIYRFFTSTDKEEMKRNVVMHKKKYGWDKFVANVLDMYKQIKTSRDV